MKIIKISLISLFLLLVSIVSYPQDKRTTETKVADLLARLPANDVQNTDKLMGDMLLLGESGLRQICDKIIPAGTGDNTGARYAVESFTRFLSDKAREDNKTIWEKICISYAIGQKDIGVKDFFMKQLQLIGSDASVEAMKIYLLNKELCEPAVAVISAAGGKTAETILAGSLKEMNLPCASSVMNSLALIKSQTAVSEYITWASNSDISIKTSALNALAMSGSPLAFPVLSDAANAVAYKWEPAGATASLLNYAKSAGQNGDIKTMDKICKLIIAKCNDSLTIQYKTVALDTYVGFHGIEAMPAIIKASNHPDKKYRIAAMKMSLAIPGPEIVMKWIKYFPKASPAAKPGIITILGIRGDEMALPLITESLSDKDIYVRREAAEAIVKVGGSQAINSLINYTLLFSSVSDQEAAKSALMTVMGSDNMSHLVPVMKQGNPAASKTAIELLAWNKDNQYFAEVLPFTGSGEKSVSTAAFKALAALAGPADQGKLIGLLDSNDNPEQIANIQAALAVAANKVPNPEMRSSVILTAIGDKNQKEKLIPVLARTGGDEALAYVQNEFENGNPALRDICFKTLSEWKDYTASSALYEICASGNKTFEGPAFEGYVRQVTSARLSDERKLLLLRKIMPFALSPDRKNKVISEIGELKTYQSLFFVASYLDDPSTAVEAAKAAMRIALPAADSGIGMFGDLVREILIKATGKLTSLESDYEKEMINKYLSGMTPGEGFKPIFNGRDLTGWQGLVENPVARLKMKKVELERKQAEANVIFPANWSVKDGCIWFNGSGDNLCTVKEYSDFEMFVDWKISKDGDSGIYLRGSPQVQIWDNARVDVGAEVGSGGLYNNEINPSKPLKVADNAVGEWNTFRILMMGEKVSVWLNGELVVDNVTLENYWDRKIPIFPRGAIELQAHGTDLAFRDIYVREINDKEYNLTSAEKAEGFVALFNGKNLDNWVGNKKSYVAEDGMIVVKPDDGSGGNLFSEKEYADFIFRFEFLLTPGANNGLGIRAPLTGDAAYAGMELQILDNTAPVYADLKPYQYHGSVYGVIPAKREYLKPVGEWNTEEVIVKGTQIKIILNGTTIVEGDIAGPRDNGTMDHNEHPGLKNKTGHIGFLGHGSELKFRNIRIKEL
jgi:hypothetical protein